MAAKSLSLLSAKVSVPQHVVYRTFPSETVVLNLHTGRYHGLNVSAGKMLETLERARSVREAARELAVAYRQPVQDIERDLCRLCDALFERGLIDFDDSVSG